MPLPPYLSFKIASNLFYWLELLRLRISQLPCTNRPIFGSNSACWSKNKRFTLKKFILKLFRNCTFFRNIFRIFFSPRYRIQKCNIRQLKIKVVSFSFYIISSFKKLLYLQKICFLFSHFLHFIFSNTLSFTQDYSLVKISFQSLL